MEFKKLQKTVDKGLTVLSDHDEKRNEERYINLQNAIEEAQDYIEKGVYSNDIDKELHEELLKCIKKFEKDNWIFIIFLIILCGMLFIGVFYITYSHFFDHWYHGGHFHPPKTTHTRRTTVSNRTEVTDITSSTITEKTTSAVSTTTENVATKPSSVTTSPSSDDTTDRVTDKTTTKITDKTTTGVASTTITTSTARTTTVATTTTKPTEDPDDSETGFVTVIFDNSSLIDLDNVFPMLDKDGLKTKPTTWKLSSTLSKGSKDYVVQYTVNFIDLIDEIDPSNRLDISNLKFQLVAKNNGVEQYNSGVQYLDDYPEVNDGLGNLYRPIITINTSGNTFKNNDTLDFELRMWLDSAVGNSEQGKKYKFRIFIEAGYEFIE